MSITPGTRVGVYEVGELLGEGGMGAVYRAHDSRLGRDVAIKVIRQDLVADSDRVARFDREARLLASLSHPHIATIHGLEHVGDVQLLVLELVPGVSLDERLREGPIPVREALTIALQIAAGIEAAHDRGIIHRDLKPANIKLTPSGTVKILDFGLAKALSTAGAADPKASARTMTVSGTAEGVILGTAAYMSPEQARGKEVDKRTDIWAFGCVLYDMLAGQTPFGAETLSDTLAAILTREPDWSRLPSDTPASIVRLLHRCLHKDAHRRLRDIGDARLEIDEALAAKSGDTAADTAISESRVGAAPAGRRLALMLAAAALVGAALATTAWFAFLRPREAPERTTAQFALTLPGNERVEGLDFPAIAISPLDTHVAYVGSRGGPQQLFIRPMSSLEAQPVAGTEGATCPFFSPDGEWIGFFASGSLKKVPVAGGPVRTISEAQVGFGGAWAADNTIVYAPNNASELWQVSADGGKPKPVTSLDTAKGEFSHRWPEMLPDGKSVLFAIGTEGSWDDAVIALQTIGSTSRSVIVQGGTSPHLSPTGHMLYTRAGVLHALPFDVKGRQRSGNAVADLGHVIQSSDGASQVSISRAGTLVFLPASDANAGRTLVWVDRQGNLQPLAAPPRLYESPRLSPDGRTIAVTIGDDGAQVWTYDIAGNRLTQFTFDGGFAPVWGHDGSRIVFAASRGGPADLFSRALDGGTVERLTTTPRMDIPHAWTPDGGVLFVEADPNGRDVSLLSTDHTVRPLLATASDEMAPAVSRDGQWLAYVSDESGQAEVYVTPLKNRGTSVAVSASGGTEPMWSGSGDELFFRAGTRMMAAKIRTRPTLSVQSRDVLFHGNFHTGSASRPAYDVTKDGTRFLLVRSPETDTPGKELRVVMGWRLR